MTKKGKASQKRELIDWLNQSGFIFECGYSFGQGDLTPSRLLKEREFDSVFFVALIYVQNVTQSLNLPNCGPLLEEREG
jgi:hypothetical protein